MAGFKQLEFFLLRYVPNAVREEFVNIGLLAREVDGGFTAVRITEDWGRVRCVDPEVDLDILRGLGLQLKHELQETQDWVALRRKLEDLFSNLVQVSAVKACLAEDGAREMEALTKLYLEGPRRVGSRVVSGRQVILRGMEEAFESAGVLPLMQRSVGTAEYTGKKGDPLRIDFVYPVPNGVRFLQAVSLKASVQPAMVLGARFPAIARDVLARHGAAASLTAVVDDELDRGDAEIGFALALMEESRIQVEPVSEMPRMVAEVRRELGA